MKLVISAGRFPDLEVRLATGPTLLRARARRHGAFQYRLGGSTEASALPRFLGSMHEHIAPDSTSRSHVPRDAACPTDRARLRGQRGRDRSQVVRCLVAGSFQPFLEALRGCEVTALQATPAHPK